MSHFSPLLPSDIFAYQVMEQLVDRLDVAMFNAILRDSEEEMPTDPMSDPISELKVLPIPAGKSSFGAGAQLKNAVSNLHYFTSCYLCSKFLQNEKMTWTLLLNLFFFN